MRLEIHATLFTALWATLVDILVRLAPSQGVKSVSHALLRLVRALQVLRRLATTAHPPSDRGIFNQLPLREDEVGRVTGNFQPVSSARGGSRDRMGAFQSRGARVRQLLDSNDLDFLHGPPRQLGWSPADRAWLIRGDDPYREMLYNGVVKSRPRWRCPVTMMTHPLGLDDPLDPTFRWIQTQCFICQRPVIVVDPWSPTFRWTQCFNCQRPIVPVIVMADGMVLAIDPYRKWLLWIDRLSFAVHRICVIPFARYVTAFEADLVQRRLLYLDPDSRSMYEVTGLPRAWFAPKSHIHNWRRVAFLIAFMRSNRGHWFADCGLQLVSQVLRLLV